MKYLSLISLFLIFSGQKSNAQIDSILALPGKDRQLKGFIDWAISNIYWDGRIDTDRKLVVMKEATEKFRRNDNQKLIREAWFFSEVLDVGSVMRQPVHWEEAAMKMLKLASESHEKKWFYTEAEFRMAASAMYFNKTAYAKGFEQAHWAYDIIKREGLANYPEASRLIAELAERYYLFANYETAIYYIKEALNVPYPWASMHRLYIRLNTLAYCYRFQRKYDSAVYFLKQAHYEAVRANDKFWIGNTNGNLGSIYSAMGRDDEALPLLLNDFEYSKTEGQTTSAANAASSLASIYIRKGDISTAKKYIEYSKRYFDTSSAKAKANVYERLSKVSRLQKDYRQSYIYLDSFIYFNEKLSKQRDLKIITLSKQMLQVEKYASELKILESEKQLQALSRNGLIVGFIMICVVATLIVNRIRTKKNIAIKTTLLEKKLLAEELDHSRLELSSFTKQLTEKNAMIEIFRKKNEKIRSDTIGAQEERRIIIDELTQATLLTEEEWTRFKSLFDKAYPGFFVRLKEKMPDVSPSDVRLMALTKLKINHKDMAAMLGVGYDAIRKAKKQLQGKANLNAEDSIEELADLL